MPELIPTGAGSPSFVRVSPDAAGVIYPVLSAVPGESRLMRAPPVGGPPQVIFERTRILNFSCARRSDSLCVLAESTPDGKDYVFSSFDPASAARHELFRTARNPVNWTVSPDGSRIAIIGDDSQGRIEIRSLTGQIESKVEARGWPHPFTLDWAADGKSLFISHPGLMDYPSGPIGAAVLHVNFDGRVQPVGMPG